MARDVETELHAGVEPGRHAWDPLPRERRSSDAGTDPFGFCATMSTGLSSFIHRHSESAGAHSFEPKEGTR